MGSTSFAHNGKGTLELLKKEFQSSNSYGEWKWLDHACKGSVYYVLMEFTPAVLPHNPYYYVPELNGSYRYLMVVLTNRARGELTYKDMSESMGPYYFDCPKRLIDKASLLIQREYNDAIKWRADCAIRMEANERRKAIKPGTKFRTDKPVKFASGVEISEWICDVRTNWKGRKQTIYRPLSGSLQTYRFNPMNYGFSLIYS